MSLGGSGPPLPLPITPRVGGSPKWGRGPRGRYEGGPQRTDGEAGGPVAPLETLQGRLGFRNPAPPGTDSSPGGNEHARTQHRSRI